MTVMNAVLSTRRLILLLAVLISVAVAALLITAVSTNDGERREVTSASPSAADLPAKAPAPAAAAKIPASTVPAALPSGELAPPDPAPADVQAPTGGDANQVPAQPTQRQQEYQVLLEQKIDGDIQVYGPLLPEILNSDAFAALTRQQRNAIAQRIVERLNSGELKPEDVYP